MMADKQQMQMQMIERGHVQISGKTAVLASAAGLIIGGPLVGLMGMSFVATTTLLLISSPLLIIFSPVLFGAVCVFVLAMIGFAVAGAMAVAGLWSVAWVLQSGRRQMYGGGGGGGGVEKEKEKEKEGRQMQWHDDEIEEIEYNYHVPYQTY